MGQGTDSCGGYDVEYDAFEEGIARGFWPARGGDIKLSEMSLQHLKNAKRYCQQRARTCNFTGDADDWNERADMFDNMIDGHRPKANPTAVVAATSTAPKAKPRGKMVAMICHCKTEYEAREADLKRGYGYSCGKRCAAIRREFGRPKAIRKVVAS